MQNLPLLLTEARALGATVVRSDDRWSPVAAVRMHDVELPAAVRPGRVGLEILIPDLFGFATDASIVVFDTPIERADGGPVPFQAPLDAAAAQRLAPFLPALRSPGTTVLGQPHLCLLPESGPPNRYHHLPLPEFAARLLDYLSAPVEGPQADLATCRRLWELTGDPWWLRRLAHALEGLGLHDEAMAANRTGQERFPHRADFATDLRRLEARA